MSSLHDGGCAVVMQDGRILIDGGSDASGATAKVDIFNTDGSWSAAPPMLSPRTHQACAALQDGRVLVAGGITTGSGITNSAEMFDPSANVWSQLPPMSEARAGATTTVLQDGRVLLAGGQTTAGPSNSIEIFDPNTQAFNFAGTMSASRQDAAAVLLQDGRVLIVGGSGVDANGNPVILGSSDIYDPGTGSVSPGPALVTARSKHSATMQLDGKVAVIGGNDGSNDLASIEVYDPLAAGNFTVAAASLATPRSGHLAFLLPKNNEVLVVGGQSGGVDMASAEVYVPWGNQGAGADQSTGSMAAARSQASGAALSTSDGLLLVAGGSTLTTAELYSFATVTTDQSDYPPGATVTITGGGWQPGETVTLTLVESPLIDSHPVMTAVADQNGNIFNNQFSPDSHDVNVRFYLTATGSQSQAQNTFTDAPQDSLNSSPNNFNLALNPGQAIPSSTVLYTVTQASGTGAKHTTFPVSVSVTLQGSFGTLSTSNVIIGSYASSGSVTLGGRVPCNQPAGTVTLKINGDASANPNLSPNKANTPVNITVSSTPDSSCVIPTTTTIISGSGQTTTYGSPVANPLVAAVSATGFTPTGSASLSIDGGAVVDTETLDANGRATFAASFASTLSAGAHTLHVAYTPAAGSNFVASSADGAVTVTQATPGITWATPADIVYGTPLTATQLNATASVPGTFVYNPAASTVLSAGSGQQLSVTFTPTDTSNYTTAVKSVSINVNKADATIVANGYTGVYDGSVHGGTGTATGVNNEDLSGLLHFTAGFSDVPGGTVSWTFDGNTNYNSASGSVQIAISQAQATVNVTGYTGVYDGNAHGATGTVTGVKGEDLSSLLNLGASFTDVPGGTASWAFGGNTDYKSANGSVAIVITQADANISVQGYSGVYDGNPHGATGSATGVKGENLSNLLALGASFTDVPGGTANWSFAGNTNYKSANGSAVITITPAPATIKVTGYTGTYDGSAHGATGSALGVKGENLGSLLNLGSSFTDVPGGMANWSFAGNIDYQPASGSVQITINKADSTVSITVASVTFDGSPHGATVVIVTGAGGLNQPLSPSYSGTTVSGATYGSSPSAPTHAGTYQVSASFGGDNNHNPSSGSATFTIFQASSSTLVTVPGGASFTYDSTSHPATISVTGAGGLNMAPAPLYSCGHVPTYVADSGCTASYSFAGDNDHTGSSGSVTYSISRASLVVTANSMSMVLDAPLPQLTGSLAGVLGADGITATYTTAATGTVIGTFPITPVLSDPNNRLPNYNLTSNNGTLTVQYAAVGVCYGDYGHQILAPIAANGTSTFKQRSTIPAKFRVCDALGNSISAPNAKGVPVVAAFNLVTVISGTVTQTVDETVASTTPDTSFRWDATNQQWIFNISTSSLSVGATYVYQISLNDGTNIQFQYGLPR